MLRYLRLYANFVRFSFSRAMWFRLDFFFRVGMDVLWNVMYLTFFTVLFSHTQLLGGWNKDQVIIFAAAMFVEDAIQMAMFSNNMWWLPFLVNRGDLDYYLVRPVSALFFVSLRDFAANSFLNLLIACGILVWALGRYPDGFGAGSIALFLVLLFAGAVLHYILHMMFIIPVFWLQSKTGMRDIGWSLSRFSGRPDKIFRGWVRRALVSVLPYAFVASYPVRGLLEGMSTELLLHTAAVLAGGFVVMVAFWRLGLRSYASASS